MSNVVDLRGYLVAVEAPHTEVLEQAKADLRGEVLVIGYDKDGSLYVRAAGMSQAEAVWLLEKVKGMLL